MLFRLLNSIFVVMVTHWLRIRSGAKYKYSLVTF